VIFRERPFSRLVFEETTFCDLVFSVFSWTLWTIIMMATRASFVNNAMEIEQSEGEKNARADE